MLVKMPNGTYIDPTDVVVLESFYLGHDQVRIQVLHKPVFEDHKTTVAECKRDEVDKTMAACADVINTAIMRQNE